MKQVRQGRLEEEIRKSISSLLLNGIKDPGLTSRIITISEVRVTRDGSFAYIYLRLWSFPVRIRKKLIPMCWRLSREQRVRSEQE